jgi:hypothetical protein
MPAIKRATNRGIKMRTLTLSTGSFDQINTFGIHNPRSRYGLPIWCSLKQDYQTKGDGVFWALQSGTSMKSSYTEADDAETNRMKTEDHIKNGEIVLIDGKQYRCRVLGDYSDAAIFDTI